MARKAAAVGWTALVSVGAVVGCYCWYRIGLLALGHRTEATVGEVPYWVMTGVVAVGAAIVGVTGLSTMPRAQP